MVSKLKNLSEFKKLLANYQISEAGKQILSQTELVLLLAPSGGGRNTIIKELVKSGKFYYVVSDTTREPRVNNGELEKDGVNYWFRTEEQMLDAIKAGDLLEAEVIHNQQVSGMSIRELDKARQQGKIAITDIDIGGVQNILNNKPDAKVLLMLPPNFDEWMRRLQSRGVMEKSEQIRRLQTALQIFEAVLHNEHYSIVINDTVANAVKEVNDYIKNISDTSIHEKGRALAKKLIKDTKQFLDKSTLD